MGSLCKGCSLSLSTYVYVCRYMYKCIQFLWLYIIERERVSFDDSSYKLLGYNHAMTEPCSIVGAGCLAEASDRTPADLVVGFWGEGIHNMNLMDPS